MFEVTPDQTILTIRFTGSKGNGQVVRLRHCTHFCQRSERPHFGNPGDGCCKCERHAFPCNLCRLSWRGR
jgi:hypothetical protein